MFIPTWPTVPSRKTKITKANGADLDADEPVGPVNLWLHSLYSQVEIFLNNKLVTPTSTAYPYRAYKETILNFSKGAKSYHFTPALYYGDRTGKLDSVNPVVNARLKGAIIILKRTRWVLWREKFILIFFRHCMLVRISSFRMRVMEFHAMSIPRAKRFLFLIWQLIFVPEIIYNQ